MKIGIDISQLAYENVGVSNYLYSLIRALVKNKDNEYILLYSARSRKIPDRVHDLAHFSNVKIKKLRLSPSVLDVLWNRLHKIPVEKFVGPVDLFITSDWTEPPTSTSKKATIIYDLVVLKRPGETDKKIIKTHKRKLKWVKKESDAIFCISESTKKDVQEFLEIDSQKLHVIYPGID